MDRFVPAVVATACSASTNGPGSSRMPTRQKRMGSTQLTAILLGTLILVTCEAAYNATTATAAAPNAMALEGKYPDMDAAIKLVKNNEPDLSAYLRNPDSKCTFFVPTAQALTELTRTMGKYAGLAAQNKTLTRSTLNYHVVPGMALTADQIGSKGVTKALTRANETLYFWRDGNKPTIYTRPDYPWALNRTNIRAGNCIVHTVDVALLPPTAMPMVVGWLEELGTMPKARPKGQWAPQQKPLPESLEAGGASTAQPAPAPAPARSGSSSSGTGHMCWPASVLVMLSAVAAVAFAI